MLFPELFHGREVTCELSKDCFAVRTKTRQQEQRRDTPRPAHMTNSCRHTGSQWEVDDSQCGVPGHSSGRKDAKDVCPNSSDESNTSVKTVMGHHILWTDRTRKQNRMANT